MVMTKRNPHDLHLKAFVIGRNVKWTVTLVFVETTYLGGLVTKFRRP